MIVCDNKMLALHNPFLHNTFLSLNKYEFKFPANNRGDLLPSCWSDVSLSIIEN